MTAAPASDVTVIVLTLGDRPDQLRAAVDSALDQHGVAVDTVVIANGVPAAAVRPTIDERAGVVQTAHNVGIPAGRNRGADEARAPLLAFLDDDARFAERGVLARCARAFDAEPDLAVVALRIVDDDGETARRHVPRVGSRPDRSGPVTSFLGGAVVVRRRAFADVGGYAGEFGYAMEETDLALRLVDAGWTIRYDGTPGVVHPRTDPSRHAGAAERTMRNRVWLAYRNLPAPIAVGYVANWMAIATVRRPGAVGSLARGVVDGWRTAAARRAFPHWVAHRGPAHQTRPAPVV